MQEVVMELLDAKQALRVEARIHRARLAKAMPGHAARLAAHAGELTDAPGAVVGGYAALPGEADPARLLAELARLGALLALPRVAAKAMPLAFHRWRSGDALAPGAFGVPEPDPAWPPSTPSVVLVPLLAFDALGWRLGYGGGYYDRTLAALRARHAIAAVGVAYAGQEVENVPYDAHDEPLDMILTELGLRVFRARA
ncbi:MAG: 5-formyltetrahydrofolate cyclo-ligase [Alphaproteobacteria bacterium]|nr:5-formyltetrahydrofolate cyclo-ligase [Alphaproteobacteria bacterium]